MSKSQVFKDLKQQFVICVICRDTATNREFLQTINHEHHRPTRFDSVNDCVQYLRDKMSITEDELDAGAFKFINFSHIALAANQVGQVFDYDNSWFLPRTDIHSKIVEGLTHRFNLLNQPDYSPYCGNGGCMKRAPFAKGVKQFHCVCGWVSQYPDGFIENYGKVWVQD